MLERIFPAELPRADGARPFFPPEEQRRRAKAVIPAGAPEVHTR
ncbi:MAG: hypothetical protein BLITH_0279 [Brockia lithotrophica]|uniref:Uncharacterized protein n=1 Tax=Brockia lithotrophica TaxID=933949 RepID=A0A2T5GAI3_9BACL|nr:MAG: hypothetical protein BLITH_0279 [Brockia lithotrophica]